MQYTITINQVRALEWGLNAQQALLFAFLYTCPSWCRPHSVGDETYYHIAKSKVIAELPLLTDKPDTVYRLLRQLRDKGAILLTSAGRRTLFALTDQGRSWNRRIVQKIEITEENPTSEKNPADVGKKSEVTPEKYPTDQGTSNPSTQSVGRGSRLPADWQPTADYFQAAANIHPGITEAQVWTVAENFRDYWTSRSGPGAVKRDWLATWRMWLRKERQLPPADPRNKRTRDMTLREQLTDTSWA